ncbi:aldo/keto reductase family oxidoreductase [Chryseobacterium sp. HSC-36S06]|uniref:aldo/keto reductase n=1 Tax=Chryseobacterium sp. HSC-36S06 TaxID=2910970 RepID=UPI0020A1565C|nr:aldo/keto reductase [Chryseobacterium sp. HSC-36S06]MCP2038552.1 putative oxidoreductase [Chryseobacterium sp. HSC-36S06]
MKFSPIIIGTMRWGVWGADHSAKGVQELIETSLEEGFSTFDHADLYGNYTTEKLFGDAFSEMKIKREDVQFISKCGIQMPCKNRSYGIKSYNYSREHILKSVDQSLENLQTDYLDLLLLHRPSPLMSPDEISESFAVLREQKKVRHFGVSNFSVSQYELINDAFPLITNQVEISVNKVDAFYNGTLDQLILKKLRPMAWSVMGDYFTENSAQNIRLKTVIKDLCIKYGTEENQLLLAFLLAHPARIIPVIGTSKPKTIREFRKSLTIKMDTEDWFAILQASEGREVD